MKTGFARRTMYTAMLIVGTLSAAVFVGCVRVSNGTWYVKSAPLPERWPELTPIGKVEVKTYPDYRAATVTSVHPADAEVGPMFMTLFDHIKQNDIAMTAPVDMGYEAVANSGTDDTPTRPDGSAVSHAGKNSQREAARGLGG